MPLIVWLAWGAVKIGRMRRSVAYLNPKVSLLEQSFETIFRLVSF